VPVRITEVAGVDSPGPLVGRTVNRSTRLGRLGEDCVDLIAGCAEVAEGEWGACHPVYGHASVLRETSSIEQSSVPGSLHKSPVMAE
jgi:hypothetical protein